MPPCPRPSPLHSSFVFVFFSTIWSSVGSWIWPPFFTHHTNHHASGRISLYQNNITNGHKILPLVVNIPYCCCWSFSSFPAIVPTAREKQKKGKGITASLITCWLLMSCGDSVTAADNNPVHNDRMKKNTFECPQASVLELVLWQLPWIWIIFFNLIRTQSIVSNATKRKHVMVLI